MSRLILHLGFPKTASTSLQLYLLNHKRELQKRSINYLHSKNFSKDYDLIGIIEPKIYNYIKKPKLDTETVISNLKKSSSSYKHTIISNEDFIVTLSNFSKLKEITNKYLNNIFNEIKVILYLRSPDKFALSILSHEAKYHNNFIFSHKIWKKTNLYYQRLKYEQLINTINNCFDNEIQVGWFDSEYLFEKNIISDFFFRTNLLEYYGEQFSTDINKSFDKYQIAYFIKLKKILFEKNIYTDSFSREIIFSLEKISQRKHLISFSFNQIEEILNYYNKDLMFVEKYTNKSILDNLYLSAKDKREIKPFCDKKKFTFYNKYLENTLKNDNNLLRFKQIC